MPVQMLGRSGGIDKVKPRVSELHGQFKGWVALEARYLRRPAIGL